MYWLWTYDKHAVGLWRALSIMTLWIVVFFCQSNYIFLHDQSHIHRENFSYNGTFMAMAQTERSSPSHFQSWHHLSAGYKILGEHPHVNTWPGRASFRLLAFPANATRGAACCGTTLFCSQTHSTPAEPPTTINCSLSKQRLLSDSLSQCCDH